MRCSCPSGPDSHPANPSVQSGSGSVHADGDTVIVVWDGRGVANDGEPYENSYAWFMTMKNGKVVDGTAFYDSIPSTISGYASNRGKTD